MHRTPCILIPEYWREDLMIMEPYLIVEGCHVKIRANTGFVHDGRPRGLFCHGCKTNRFPPLPPVDICGIWNQQAECKQKNSNDTYKQRLCDAGGHVALDRLGQFAVVWAYGVLWDVHSTSPTARSGISLSGGLISITHAYGKKLSLEIKF